MGLHESVISRDYKLFTSLIDSGVNVCQVDANGDTVLHHLARDKEFNSVVSSIGHALFAKPGLFDWINRIANSKTIQSMSALAIVQNIAMDTCMHIAIENENWSFACLLQGGHLNYGIYPDRMRRNSFGLTEYEFALVLYGIRGRAKELDAVFGEVSKIYCPPLGTYYSPFSGVRGISDGFLALKKATKAAKMIKLTLKNGNVISYDLSHSHELFKIAYEDEYPSPYARFEDEQHLESLYEAIGAPHGAEKK